MELEAIRKYVQDHPDGVRLRMVDGTNFDIPHRDYIWFFPPRETLSGKKLVQGTSFMVADHRGWESMRLVNALLVVEAMPLPPNSARGRRRKAS